MWLTESNNMEGKVMQLKYNQRDVTSVIFAGMGVVFDSVSPNEFEQRLYSHLQHGNELNNYLRSVNVPLYARFTNISDNYYQLFAKGVTSEEVDTKELEYITKQTRVKGTVVIDTTYMTTDEYNKYKDAYTKQGQEVVTYQNFMKYALVSAY